MILGFQFAGERQELFPPWDVPHYKGGSRVCFGNEIHHFDPGAVRIVGIQAVFAVSSHLRPIECSQPVDRVAPRRREHLSRRMKNDSAPKFFVVGIGGMLSMYHRVGAVRDLEFVPVHAVILETADQ